MSKHTPRYILVTGGAGFIGANYVHHLLACDPEVKVVTLDKLTYAGCMENLAGLPDEQRHVFAHGDICNAALVKDVIRDHAIDTIVHFAAESHVDRSIENPLEFATTNVIGTLNLLEAAHKYWRAVHGPDYGSGMVRFHHVSTDEVYGSLSKHDPAFTEDTPYDPRSPYSASKASSDHFVRAYHHTYGLPVTISNCSNNYGPRQHPEKLIPKIIYNCLNNDPIPIYGNGSNIRDWLYVDDHCSALTRILTHGDSGATYNVGGHNEWSNLKITGLICALMDERFPAQAPHDRLIEFVKDRPGHDWRYAIEPGLLENTLGWQPVETFETGIEKTLDWYLELFSSFSSQPALKGVTALA